MLNNVKRVSIERTSLERKSLDRKILDGSSILVKKSSDDSINNSPKYSSGYMSYASKKKKILLFTEDSNDSDFEYY